MQGFPDGWVDIGDWVDENGKLHKESDSAKYKAIGNAIAIPFWKVLAKKISACYDRDATMGSFFDGISGFCIAFKQVGVEPRFSSEIEGFCVAVCKKHFGDEEAGIEGDYKEFL